MPLLATIVALLALVRRKLICKRQGTKMVPLPQDGICLVDKGASHGSGMNGMSFCAPTLAVTLLDRGMCNKKEIDIRKKVIPDSWIVFDRSKMC